LWLLWFGLLSAGSEAAAAYRTEEAVVEAVIDGDTVLLEDGRKVRYIGIDTPEVRRQVGDDWVYDPKPLAEAATALNQTLVQGKRVRLEVLTEAEHDRYGRLLAYLFVGPVFVNERLVEEGFAKLYTRRPHLKYYSDLKAALAKAKAMRLGLWSDKR
jgi:micrococcal nuclease